MICGKQAAWRADMLPADAEPLQTLSLLTSKLVACMLIDSSASPLWAPSSQCQSEQSAQPTRKLIQRLLVVQHHHSANLLMCGVTALNKLDRHIIARLRTLFMSDQGCQKVESNRYRADCDSARGCLLFYNLHFHPQLPRYQIPLIQSFCCCT